MKNFDNYDDLLAHQERMRNPQPSAEMLEAMKAARDGKLADLSAKAPLVDRLRSQGPDGEEAANEIERLKSLLDLVVGHESSGLMGWR